ncbi:MAG: DUF1345 domain-containing protein [Burkholderiales bacterium]|nr:DUF1345 domain-containing protein [Burkholderiales bacterium]
MTRLARYALVLRARPRLWSAVAIGVAAYLLLPQLHSVHAGSRTLLAWNACTLSYLALAAHMVLNSDTHEMRRRAVRQNDGRLLVLTMVVVASVAVLVAIASQLATLKDLPAPSRPQHAALAALTVVTSWLFTQSSFALNYAHDFYVERSHGRPDPLTFPGTNDPSYADFLYFACIIGTSGQTADISFNGSALRPVGLVHSVLAFFFNTTVLALTINIAAGLF